MAKFFEKANAPKLGIKNVLFGYFWARIQKKTIPYLKSALWWPIAANQKNKI